MKSLSLTKGLDTNSIIPLGGARNLLNKDLKINEQELRCKCRSFIFFFFFRGTIIAKLNGVNLLRNLSIPLSDSINVTEN